MNDSLNETNSTTTTTTGVTINHDDDYLYVIPPDLRLVFTIAFYSVSVISIFGNVLIIYVVACNKRMHNVTNYFITNLAFVDIIISIFSTPLQVGSLNLSELRLLMYNENHSLNLTFYYFLLLVQVSYSPVLAVAARSVPTGTIRHLAEY